MFVCTCSLPAQDSLLAKKAPSFTRASLEGQTVRLDDYRGRVVLLNFWATWCVPCQVELPRFAEWQRQYGAQGLQVLAVTMDDSPRAPRALARKLNLNFPVAIGDDALGTLYGGVLGLPVSFVIARDGTVMERVEGETDLAALEARIRKQLAQ
ncbi:MAG: TlpA disulfide reductase family protein [Terracidiphilus sp.]|nr:TlpA disulfide reductase family protein [Terracidiphilus sp.]